MRLFAIIFSFILTLSMSTSAQDKSKLVRIARLEIDSSQLEQYKAMLKEGIETAVRVEPGVLTLFAVYDQDHPTQVTVFEVYAGEAAYEAHLQTAHFKKYKSGTREMVKHLELIKVSPIALETKGQLLK
jgi:quinol monooxygenase YgiN